MTRQEIIDELQSIEYQLDSGHITDAQSDLNYVIDTLEKKVIDDETVGVEIHYEDIQIDGC
jgi:hypothetical protein